MDEKSKEEYARLLPAHSNSLSNMIDKRKSISIYYDENNLKSSLDRINSEIQQYLNEFNRTIQKENSHGWLTDQLHEVENYMKDQNAIVKLGSEVLALGLSPVLDFHVLGVIQLPI
ncbi:MULTISPECIES: hypothetical protein [Enterococcus]|uniref:hypothetical protein n=1 Tax=Enterococcus TaxID=1350 RepID=UPI0011634829|nr:hypothetical protein [Enterococcus avium]HAP3021194.1 hypothetical protein [Enterococcus faecalis]AYQ24228.1 hypothetical protein AUF16_06440 [Enterococcus avium]HBI1562022.1 hypothetical protein [Enterococcus faecalis]HBI1565081.1 hypothetical protein [Enterococcus faecalis]HBI1717391.1 hypothetical protein [Enterococcus faecalis]